MRDSLCSLGRERISQKNLFRSTGCIPGVNKKPCTPPRPQGSTKRNTEVNQTCTPGGVHSPNDMHAPTVAREFEKALSSAKVWRCRNDGQVSHHTTTRTPAHGRFACRETATPHKSQHGPSFRGQQSPKMLQQVGCMRHAPNSPALGKGQKARCIRRPLFHHGRNALQDVRLFGDATLREA